MANIAAAGNIRAIPNEQRNQRIVELCKEEKEQFEKRAIISKVVFAVLSPLIIPGKIIYEAEKALSNKVKSLTKPNRLVGVIVGLFQLTYGIPALGIRVITAPLSGIFDGLRFRINEKFDYLSEGFDKASRVGDIQSLEILLAAEDTTQRHKVLAMRQAAQHGQQAALNLLLDHTDVKELPEEVKGDILRNAAKYGDLDLVKSLVKRLEIKTTYCSGAVREAIEKENPQIGCYLINIDRHQLSHLVDEVFVMAAKQGFAEGVSSLLEPKRPTWALGSALKVASENGHLEIVKLLAPIKELGVREHKYEAMVKACENGCFEVLKVLIANSDTARLSGDVKGILLEKISIHGNLDIVTFLIENLNIQQHNFFGAIRKALDNGHVEIACHLVESDVKKFGHFIVEFLNQAVDKRFFQGIEALLDKDLDGYYFAFALEKAVQKSDREIVRMIAPKVGDHESKTRALLYAVEKGSLEIVQDLIDSAGVSVYTRRNIADQAQQKGLFEIAQVIQNSVTMDDLAERGDLERLRAFMERNQVTDSVRKNAAIISAAHGKEDAFRFLLQTPSALKFTSKEIDLMLFKATGGAFVNILDLLLDIGRFSPEGIQAALDLAKRSNFDYERSSNRLTIIEKLQQRM